MLSRTAENLFWTARYLERAEAAARLIEMGRRMTLIPGPSRDEWRSVAAVAGAAHLFDEDERITEARIVEKLVLCPDSPASIRYCLNRARDSARAVRTSLTAEMWEALNDGWRRLEIADPNVALRELPALLDWVKTRASIFRGASEASMLRTDRYYFLRIGGFLERSELTLRLLDVKYFVLLPETETVGGGRDHHQWTSVLQATSASRAYHHVYRGDFSPWKITDFLILNLRFPRSVAYCYTELSRYLGLLALAYGQRNQCHSLAGEMVARLADTEMGELFQSGLHEFTTEALRHNARLSAAISRAYYF
ncbi:alpha-E domain-containing protein [Pikeienuella sp. HZG-20]|uniref:alpha-E domain-containing protein n=1 Tax=Paludibacillus litoralis TaxID=3133267 RepID=UPI0030EBA3BC